LPLQFYHHAKPFLLENGETLPEITLAYRTYGKLNADKSNVIWICHALTANADPADWWGGLVGEGKFFNPETHFIVCVNVLGSCYGSTNALSVNFLTQKPYFHTFPLITIRDMVSGLDLVRQHLGIEKIKLITGGSLGAMQALEWAIMQPQLFENLVPMATNARHSAWGIAFNQSQRMAIENDPTWQTDHPEAGKNGMKTARAIALLSYRNYYTYYMTQTDPDDNKTDDFRASSYQQYQGEKLYKRFDAFAYRNLSKAMDSHHVGRNRISLEDALQAIRAKTLVIGISSDVLFPVEEQQFLAKHIPGAFYCEIDSLYGHDGFLLENKAITDGIRDFLEI
jgi:homoserine O-acetyltransferase/O-succinyltransferase